MNEIAIIGPTASGKSDLALKIAQKHNAYIFSIDSLSIYKEIDIASAKPSKEELALIKHYGVDELLPNEHFSVALLIKLYEELRVKALEDKKNIIIVGGSSFYLKTLIEGISNLPSITSEIELQAEKMLQNLEDVYNLLKEVDAISVEKIASNDRYRLEKLLLIYLASNQAPSTWFKNHPPKPTISNTQVYNIEISRELLRQRITTRTQNMVAKGLIDEVCYLEHKYTREPNSMGAIGIIEVLKYLDGFCTKDEMIADIILNTGQLAKRQQTFNRTQFQNVISLDLDNLYQRILGDLKLEA